MKHTSEDFIVLSAAISVALIVYTVFLVCLFNL